MKKLLLIIAIIALSATTVHAAELLPPEPPAVYEQYIPEKTQTFWDGVFYIFKNAIATLQPSVKAAAGICLSLFALTMLLAALQGVSGGTKRVTDLAATIAFAGILLQPTNSMINAGTKIIDDMAQYGKLLLPVLTTALASQGAVSTSAALYAGTSVFLNLLTTVVSNLIVPMLYIYLCFCIADRALHLHMLSELKKFVKWLMTWSLKIVIYVFTGYISITGVISGTVDSQAIKATKLTISGVVPVIGNIISDASESVLISAGIVKNSIGIYGMWVILAMFLSPFLQIGVQYLMLKLTNAVCGVFGSGSAVDIVSDVSGAMGYVLAMIGTVSLLLLMSAVCFMKGAS